MLTAGFASVFGGGLLCHFAEMPVLKALNTLTQQIHQHTLLSDSPASQSKLDALMQSKLGNRSNSELSLWWRTFGPKMSHALQLPVGLKHIFDTSILDEGTIQTTDKLVNVLIENAKNPDFLKSAKAFINKEQQHLETKETELTQWLEAKTHELARHWFGKETSMPAEEKLNKTKAILARYQEDVRLKMKAPKSTLVHLKNLVTDLETVPEMLTHGQIEQAQRKIRQALEGPTLDSVKEAFERGDTALASRLAGGYQRMTEAMFFVNKVETNTPTPGPDFARNALTSFQELGASPMSLMQTVLKNQKQTHLYRYGALGVMAGLIGACTVFIQFFLGRQFPDNAKPTPTPSKMPTPEAIRPPVYTPSVTLSAAADRPPAGMMFPEGLPVVQQIPASMITPTQGKLGPLTSSATLSSPAGSSELFQTRQGASLA
jgi:hypothetical protein